MKKLLLAAAVSSSLFLTACETTNWSGSTSFETDEQIISYGIAYYQVQDLVLRGVPLDEAAFKQGIIDALAQAEIRIDEATIEEAFARYSEQMQAQQAAEAEAARLAAQESNAAFLAANAEKEGVMVTDSGLQYKVLHSAGKQQSPTATDNVVVHYSGSLIDGVEFDSSYSRGEPAMFNASEVIPGWTEALQLMSVGDKYEVYIPYQLAYGEAGIGTIGPYATLIFQIELIEVNPAQ